MIVLITVLFSPYIFENYHLKAVISEDLEGLSFQRVANRRGYHPAQEYMKLFPVTPWHVRYI